MRHPHAHAWRSIVVLVAASIALGAFTVMGWTGPDEPKPGPTSVAEDSTAPGPDDEPSGGAASVPAVADPNQAFSCPAGSLPFHNPVLHYRLCYPEAWGFSDFRRRERLEQIPTTHLTNLHLLSAEAFPWNVGAYPFDVVVEKQAIDVELNVLQPGASIENECEPSKRRPSGQLVILTCTQAYDALGDPADAGPVTAVKFAVPLLRPPSSGDVAASGTRLLVIVRTGTARMLKEADLGWKLVRSIRPY